MSARRGWSYTSTHSHRLEARIGAGLCARRIFARDAEKGKKRRAEFATIILKALETAENLAKLVVANYINNILKALETAENLAFWRAPS